MAGVGPNLHPFGTGHRNHDALLHQCMDSLFHREAHRLFRWGLVDLGTTTLFLVVGLRWGAEGIAVTGRILLGTGISRFVVRRTAYKAEHLLDHLVCLEIHFGLAASGRDFSFPCARCSRFLRGRVRLVCGREGSCADFRRVRIPLPRCCHPFAPGLRPLTQFAGLVRKMISWKRSANLGSNASPKSNPDFSGASAVLTPAGPGKSPDIYCGCGAL